MSARRRFVVVVLLAGLAASLLAACGGGGYKVTATFDDVGDLQRQGSVQVADVRVGSISSIKLTPDFKAKVTLSISRNVRVPRESEALVRTTSLLGEKFIELRPLADPTKPPFLRDGDTIPRDRAKQAPELEFVAESAIDLLGAVSSTDVATLVETGAAAFGGRGADLKALISDLSTISATLASRTRQIAAIIDHLDQASQTLAGGTQDLKDLLTNLVETTRILVDNRQRALTALSDLSRLARVQNETIGRYRADIDRQIKQVDAILGVAVRSTQEVGTLVDFLDHFVTVLPKAIPGEFTQVYMWAIPCPQADRVKAGCPSS